MKHSPPPKLIERRKTDFQKAEKSLPPVPDWSNLRGLGYKAFQTGDIIELVALRKQFKDSYRIIRARQVIVTDKKGKESCRAALEGCKQIISSINNIIKMAAKLNAEKYSKN